MKIKTAVVHNLKQSESGLNKNSVSLAGEFAVLSQLVLRGYDANMTLGHTKNVDILVSNPKSGKMYKVEVKTSNGSKPSQSSMFGYMLGWMMNQKHETISEKNLFYVFVNIESPTNKFRFFIVPSEIVAEYVKSEHKYWLRHRPNLSKKEIDVPMRMFRIGLDREGYKIFTPLAKDYENKWTLFS